MTLPPTEPAATARSRIRGYWQGKAAEVCGVASVEYIYR